MKHRSNKLLPALRTPESVLSWLPVVVMSLMSVISYLDRATLAILAPTILGETHLTIQQYGWVVSAFSLAYMVGNPLWGFLIDRFGLRIVMAVAVLLWTIASASHAYLATFGGFAIARIILGLGEGATFPGSLRTVYNTLPQHAHGKGMSIAYSGGSIGAIVTPLIVTPLALKFGWRAAFIFTGIAGLAWVALWVATAHQVRPQRIPSEEELGAEPLRFGDSRLWAFIVLYAFGALPVAFGTYAAPLYLSKVLDLSQAMIGKLVWLLPLGWELGYVAAGQICDYWSKRNKAISGTWLGGAAVGFVCVGLPVVAAGSASSLGLVLLLLTLPMFTAGGLIILALRYGTLVFPRRSGLVAGIGAASWGATAACVMPIIGWYFDHKEYSSAFQVVAAFPICGLIGWRLLGYGKMAEQLQDEVCCNHRLVSALPVKEPA